MKWTLSSLSLSLRTGVAINTTSARRGIGGVETVMWISRKITLVTRLDKEMQALQHRWAVLLKRKDRVLKVQRWK